jgi:hypothetical protein
LRVDGVQIATSKVDLTDGTLTQPINHTESNATLDTRVWTGTLADGTTANLACGGSWTSTTAIGVAGLSSAVNGSWTVITTNGQSCDAGLSLYCFQDDCPGVPTVDFQNDPANCGACGRTCKTGQSCIRGRCGGYVFVSSTTVAGQIVSGNFRGLQAADDFCNVRAKRGQLPGAYTAWLSTTASPAPSRLVDGSFFRPDGLLVAADLARLLATASKPLANAISIDESGNAVQAGVRVFTGTNADGTANASNCANWTSLSFNGGALLGLPTATDSQWTASQTASCDGNASLYCIETDPALLP